MDRTADFYARPSYEYRGGAFNVFAGSRRQRGGSIFGTLKSMFMPVAKNLGKAALSSGIGFAQDVIKDKMMGKNLKDSLLTHGKARGLDFAKTAMTTAAKQGLLGKLTGMFGKGSRRAVRRRRRKTVRRLKKKPRRISRKSAISRRKVTSSKRRKRRKSTHKRSAKRRRIATNF